MFAPSPIINSIVLFVGPLSISAVGNMYVPTKLCIFLGAKAAAKEKSLLNARRPAEEIIRCGLQKEIYKRKIPQEIQKMSNFKKIEI